MIKFGINEECLLEVDLWAKHYKQISIHVKREYLDDGKVINPKREKHLKAMENHSDRIIEKKQEVINTKTFKSREVLDSYLVLDNLEPIESNVDYYSVGAINTEQTTHVKLMFKLDYTDVILDYEFLSKGSFASSFLDMISGSGVEYIVQEIVENEKGFLDKGIKVNENEFGDYCVIGIDNNKQIQEFEIEKHELLNSLVGIEVYKFDMIIEDLNVE